MRKWTYLVAMLMLAGATTTFTGCIDTDEPAGIEELRGAKAELLRAKVAVEAAIAAEKQANAALTLAQAKKEEALAAYEAARAKQQEEKVKQEALKTELQAAQNEAEKARIQAEIAEYAKREADAKNEMAAAAKELEISMKELEAELLAAQQAIVVAEKNLKLAQTTLTAEQQAAVDALLLRINGGYETSSSYGSHSWVIFEYDKDGNVIKQENHQEDYSQEHGEVIGLRQIYKEAQVALFKAQKALQNAMYEQKAGNFVAEAEADVKVAEYKLSAAEATAEYVAELSKLDPATTDWENEVKDLNSKIDAAKVDTANLKIELEKLHANNKTAWDTVQIAKTAFTAAGSAKYYINSYKNETLKGKTNAIELVKTVKSDFNGTYSYGETEIDTTEIAMVVDLDDPKDYGLIEGKSIIKEIKAGDVAQGYVNDLENLIKGLEDLTKDENKEILDSLLAFNINHADTIAKYDSIHKAAVAEWEILVAAKKGTKTEATEDIAALKKTVDAYNTEFNKLAPAVLAYNNAIDTLKSVENKVAVAAKDEYIAKEVAEKQDELYVTAFNSWGEDSISRVLGNNKEAWGKMDPQTKEGLDMFLTLAKKEALKTKISAKADTLYTNWAKTGYATIVAQANQEMDKAIKKDMYKNGASGEANPKSKIIPAYDALVAAWDVVYKAIPDSLDKRIKSWETAYGEFETSLENNYGQILSTPQTAATMNIQKDTYAAIKLDKDGKVTTDATKVVRDSVFASDAYKQNFGYITAAGSDIDSTEYAKMIASELDAATTEIAWGDKSTAAWGSSYADRMLPVAEDADNIGGTLKAWVDAKNAKANAEEGLVEYETVVAWVAELKTQLGVLEGEIAEAAATIQASYDVYSAKFDAYAVLDDEIVAKLNAAEHQIASYNRVKNTIVGVINAYYDECDYSFKYNDGTKDITIEFVYEDGADNAAKLADFFVKYNLYAEYMVTKAETELIAAKVDLEKAQDGTYNKVAKKTMLLEQAQADFDMAKANYEAALAELNALLASFAAAE